jgi:hypothetical protein
MSMLRLFEADAHPDSGEWMNLRDTGKRIRSTTLSAKRNTLRLHWDTWDCPYGDEGMGETCAIKLRWTRR